MTVQLLRLCGWAVLGCACVAAVYVAAGAALQRPEVLRIDGVAAASGPLADYSADGRQATRPPLDLGIIGAILSDSAPRDDAAPAPASATRLPDPAQPSPARPTETTEPKPAATDTPRPEPTSSDTPEPEPTATDTTEPEPTDTPKLEPTPTRTPKPTDTPKPTETPKHEPTATPTARPCRKPLSELPLEELIGNGDLAEYLKRPRCPTPTPAAND